MCPKPRFIFDLYRGQTVFDTGLLDPIHEIGNHRVIHRFKKITLGSLNAEDLIISKMFRGEPVDVDDSVIMIRAENIDLRFLAERYKETASYQTNPPLCKTKLSYLIQEMLEQKFDATPLQEMFEQWTP